MFQCNKSSQSILSFNNVCELLHPSVDLKTLGSFDIRYWYSLFMQVIETRFLSGKRNGQNKDKKKTDLYFRQRMFLAPPKRCLCNKTQSNNKN